MIALLTAWLFFWNPCARANLHQQKRALKLCSATLSTSACKHKQKGHIFSFFLCLWLCLRLRYNKWKRKRNTTQTFHKYKDIYHTWLCLATENTGSRLPKCSDDFACACVCVEFLLSLESSLLLTPVKTRFYCKVLNVSSDERLTVYLK